MKFLECDLEQIIMKASNEDLRDRGLFIEGFKKNQVRIGNYGVADVVTLSRSYETDYLHTLDKEIIVDVKPKFTVFELKKENVSLSTFAQGIHYIKGIKDYIEHTGRYVEDFVYELVLIGKTLDSSSSFCFLPDLFNSNENGALSVKIYLYEYEFHGIEFVEKKGYKLVNSGFKS